MIYLYQYFGSLDHSGAPKAWEGIEGISSIPAYFCAQARWFCHFSIVFWRLFPTLPRANFSAIYQQNWAIEATVRQIYQVNWPIDSTVRPIYQANWSIDSMIVRLTLAIAFG